MIVMMPSCHKAAFFPLRCFMVRRDIQRQCRINVLSNWSLMSSPIAPD